MDAEEAAAKYHELTGIGGYYPKDPALLSWRSQGTLALQVFPVPSKASKTVEYTLEMPMAYANGVYRLDIPPLGTEERHALVHPVAAHAEDRLRINGVLATGVGVEASGNVALELQPASGARITGALAEVALGGDRVLFHASTDAASRLGEVPAFASIAVVVDTSKSMADRLDVAMAAARSYLLNFPKADVTLVTFDRHVATPLGSGVPIADALARMQGFEPTAQNGSQVDEAIARADGVLAASAAGPRRMLVLTDLLTRAALPPQKLAALVVKSGATIHVATIERGDAATLVRDDEDAWAAFPRKTGGVLWRAEVAQADPSARSVFEEWARPKRIDHLKVAGYPAEFAPPETLEEGCGLEYLGITKKRSENIAVEGELWSRPVHFAATSTPVEERRWSALVFGSPILEQLSEPEQRLLAMKGRAVSPVTSYLAIEPGVRPSIEGLEESGEGFGYGRDGLGHGSGVGSSYGVGHGGRPPDPQAFLDQELGQAWVRCGGTGSGKVDLESTKAEVVDVDGVTLSNPDAKAATCLREAAWALDLPEWFNDLHANWSVRVGG
jgi:hypothetical protein